MFNHEGGARRRLFSSSLRCATALGLATLVAIPAMAQEQVNNTTGSSSASALDNDNVIMVTAQLRGQNVQDVPLSITAISGDMLEARSQTNLAEISNQTPSLLLQQNPAGSGNSMRAFIRGVGQSDHSPSVEPGVGIYIDDIYFGTVTASAFDLVDLDRIEVLRGPQGTLAGMNSQGGAIKLYSRTPQGEGGYAEVTIGENGRRDFKGSADFAIVPDSVFARITGVYRNQDGHVTRYDYACLNPNDQYVQPGTSLISPGAAAIPRVSSDGNCKLGKLGGKNLYAMRGALRIAPAGSPLEVNLIGDYSRDRSEIQASTLIASAELTNRHLSSVAYQGVPYDNRFVAYGQYRPANAVLNDPYATYANFYDPGVMYSAIGAPVGPPTSAPHGAPLGPFSVDPESDTKAWGFSGTIDFALSENFALKSITGYRTYDSVSGNDNDQSPVVFIQSQGLFEHDQFSQELRFSGSLVEDTVNFTIGGIYYDASTRYLDRIHTPFSAFCALDKPCFSFLNDDTADLTVKAAFGNIAWEPITGLTVEGGIRVTDEKKDYTFGRFNPNGVGEYLPLSNPNNPLSGLTDTYAQTITDYRAVVSYEWTPDIMTYAQFATGHKGGGIAPRPYDYRQVRPFGPEKLKSYEAGFKADLFDRRLRLNGDVFYMDYKGYQGIPNICVDINGDQLPPDQGGIDGLCGQYLNVGDAEVKGFELEAFLEPIDNFNIDASLSLTDFEFTSVNFPTTSIVVGANRPGIGEWKWSLGAQYEADLGSAGTLTPRVDVSYTPGYCGNFACAEISQVDSHTLVNMRVTYRSPDEDWSVSLEGLNLTDKFYYLNKFSNAFYTAGQPGRGREFALTVRRNF
jgi:iron complex outermembrane receptor protein